MTTFATPRRDPPSVLGAIGSSARPRTTSRGDGIGALGLLLGVLGVLLGLALTVGAAVPFTQ